ncbi:MAG: ATP-binding cassette domain-containing protein [Deltaproteobacteria bacterium]
MEIRVENLQYVYNEGTPLERKALDGITFTLSPGTILGVLGGTGSGKTTLIRNLGGLLEPTRGRVLIDGVDARNHGPGLKRNVGVAFQRPERQLFEETVFKDISFVLRHFSDCDEAEILRRVRAVSDLMGLNIDEMADRSPLALSDGEKRKVAIAGILVNDPETLILDEPAVGLDPPSVAELIAVIEDLKASGDRSVVIVSHEMDCFLPLLDLMMVLDRGRMAAIGSPGEVSDALADDPAMRDLLPAACLLVHDLQKAGYAIPSDLFAVPALTDRIARLLGSPGGCH